MDENTKVSIGLLWYCAYTECGRGHEIRETCLKGECAKICDKPLNKESSDDTEFDRKIPASEVDTPKLDKKARKDDTTRKQTLGKRVKCPKP